MSKKKEVAFELPKGVDESLQVVPVELLNNVMRSLDEVPAKYSYQIIQAVQIAVQKAEITNLGEYLKRCNDKA